MKTIGILYNDLSVLGHFQSLLEATGLSFPNVLVECAEQPLLAYGLNLETPGHYAGLRGCLIDAEKWAELAVSHESLPAPLILAPFAGISPAHSLMALRRLASAEAAPDCICVFIESDAFEKWQPVLRVMDEALALWDLEVPPLGDGEKVETWVSLIREMGTAWKGFHVYNRGSLPAAGSGGPVWMDRLDSIRFHETTASAPSV